MLVAVSGRSFRGLKAAWAGRRFAITACSGRAALLAALRAVGASEGCEVILPAYTLAEILYCPGGALTSNA